MKRKKQNAKQISSAWKIAYADFITALMSVFIVLWILGASDEEQKKGLSDYFSAKRGIIFGNSTTSGVGFF